MKEMTRTSLDLPRETKAKLKLAALRRNQTMAELLRELVDKFLQKEREKRVR